MNVYALKHEWRRGYCDGDCNFTQLYSSFEKATTALTDERNEIMNNLSTYGYSDYEIEDDKCDYFRIHNDNWDVYDEYTVIEMEVL